MSVTLVRFTPGAHTNWHRHTVGQTLHVTEGVGLVGTRDGAVLRIRAGETVVCPPDEEHWHGALRTRPPALSPGRPAAPRRRGPRRRPAAAG